jgi:hypothetical protein
MTYPWYIILLPPKNRLVKQFSHDIPIFYPISPIYKTRFPLYSHQNIPIYPHQNPDLGKVIEFFHPDLPQKKGLATRWRLRFVPMFHVLSWGIPYALLMTGAPVTFTNRFTDPGRSGDGVSQGSRWLFTSQEWLKQKTAHTSTTINIIKLACFFRCFEHPTYRFLCSYVYIVEVTFMLHVHKKLLLVVGREVQQIAIHITYM